MTYFVNVIDLIGCGFTIVVLLLLLGTILICEVSDQRKGKR